MPKVQYPTDRPFNLDPEGRPRLLVGTRWRLAEQRECWYCGVPFWAVVSHKEPVRFCSLRCRGLNRRKVWATRFRITKRCVICSAPFDIKRSHSERRKTCGRAYCITENRRRVTTRRHEETGQRVFEKIVQ